MRDPSRLWPASAFKEERLMGVAEELRTLQELREKGSLTEQEFANAKSTTIRGQATPAAAVSSARLWTTRVKVWTAILLVFAGFMWYVYRVKTATDNLLAAAVHKSATLMDSVENLPAHSMKAISFNASYNCSAVITLEVVHGNPIDIFLIDASQLDAAQNSGGRDVKAYANFNATKTKSYVRTDRLNAGSYYLMMRDRSLGIFSKSASDVSVKIQLNP
jgi:hypothetical protein